MLDVNPINSIELARAVQHDYEAAAAHHRLLKESGYRGGMTSGKIVKTTLVLTTVVAGVITVVQTLF